MKTIYAILAVAHTILPTALGRVYTQNLELISSGLTPASFVELTKSGAFGFLEGGEVHYSLTCPLVDETYPIPNFWLLFCSTSDTREFLRMTTNQLSFDCHRLKGNEMTRADAYCRRQRIFHNISSISGSHSYYKEMVQNYFYTLILLQCPNKEQDQANLSLTTMPEITLCQSVLVALNPNGGQLSSDEMPLPIIYTVVNLVWAILVAAWFFNWVIYFKFSNRLHTVISCVPIFKVVLVILVLIWWHEIANTGKESRDILAVRYFVQSIEDALLFMTMMIIAEGWGVVRCHIKHYRWTSLLLLFAVFATSLMCVNWVHKYFLAFSVCCVVFMMYKTLKWSSHNIELLRRRRRKIRRFISRHNLRYKGNVTIDSQLREKLNIYKYFRIICAVFSMVYAIAVTLSTFLTEYTYVRALTFELSELCVYIAIGSLFRLRNFEPFDNIELEPPKENIVEFELPEVSHGIVVPHVLLGVPLPLKVEKETQTPRKRWRNTIRSEF